MGKQTTPSCVVGNFHCYTPRVWGTCKNRRESCGKYKLIWKYSPVHNIYKAWKKLNELAEKLGLDISQSVICLVRNPILWICFGVNSSESTSAHLFQRRVYTDGRRPASWTSLSVSVTQQSSNHLTTVNRCSRHSENRWTMHFVKILFKH